MELMPTRKARRCLGDRRPPRAVLLDRLDGDPDNLDVLMKLKELTSVRVAKLRKELNGAEAALAAINRRICELRGLN
jgi:hypothetical protein